MTVKLFIQAIMKFAAGLISVGLLLFRPAGTFAFRQAWLFIGILFVPMLTAKATVTKLVKRSEKNGMAEVSMEIYNQNDELVMTAVTEAIVKCRL